MSKLWALALAAMAQDKMARLWRRLPQRLCGRAVLPLVLLISACPSVELGRDFDLSTFERKVERGVSTQSQVRAWLGTPTGIGIAVEGDGQRYDEWSYYYGEGRLTKMSDAHFKILRIRFDQRGVVQAWNWSGEGK